MIENEDTVMDAGCTEQDDVKNATVGEPTLDSNESSVNDAGVDVADNAENANPSEDTKVSKAIKGTDDTEIVSQAAQKGGTAMTESDTPDADPIITFEDLGLDDIALKAVERKGFVTPSPIQVLAIPRLLNGDANVIARARTGTGKTAAFGLPLTQRIRSQSDHVCAIILEPTRELAMQTCAELQSFTQGRYPRTCVVYGGASYSTQISQLRRGVEIVVGTPGRVQDHMSRGVLDISKIDYFILDEGDEMLDMGFIDDIENIFKAANPACRVLLFSATVPPPILKVAEKFMGEYEVVEEEGVVDEPLLIEQHYWVVRGGEKINALVRLIDSADDFYGLVFTQTKNDADYLCRALDERGYDAAALHGDVPQGQREKILARFRARRTRILVATDVAARGIDITGLSHVVNYSLPFDGATYVHRIGRTGRAGAAGIAITFVRPEERRKLRFIEAAIRRASKGEWSYQEVPSVDEVVAKKRERILDKLKGEVSRAIGGFDTILSKGAKQEAAKSLNHPDKSETMTDMAEKLCEGHDPKDVVAALLAAEYGDALDRAKYGEVSRATGAVPSRGDRRGRTDYGARPRGRGRPYDERRERPFFNRNDRPAYSKPTYERDDRRDRFAKNDAIDKARVYGRHDDEHKDKFRDNRYERNDRNGRDDRRYERDDRRRESGLGIGRAEKFLRGGYSKDEERDYEYPTKRLSSVIASHGQPSRAVHQRRKPLARSNPYKDEYAGKARPRVHTPTERNASPGLYRQKNKKPKERF